MAVGDQNERYLCIHGHFYQPPRQNPWLEAIEVQDSAAPFHDWNERIAAECYAPNAAARIVDGHGGILDIVNTYASLSFNFGPTLLAWLERADPLTYHHILDADRLSQEARAGHGNAMAQCYNHLIMPLANRRDKVTQVVWGIGDFQARFGRDPEGMWLPETAVDLETLDILAAHGIRFTILSPHQARRVRGPEETRWHDISDNHIDPSHPYRCLLPSGREIALFFYDEPIAKAIAFGGILSSGETLIERLIGGFHDDRPHVQLLHVATDGETYGHHHRFGEMALAYALHTIAEKNLATLTNYGQYLARFPADHLVEICDNTSWSCAHGVERWRSDCGCQTGGKPGWHQRWRKPLREALDWLRDRLAPVFEEEGEKRFIDPWAARDDYIGVILDRSRATLEGFFRQHARRQLSDAETVDALKLLEMQRHALLMYTSCAWFFAEISGIETVQILAYAARAMQLAGEVAGLELEADFLEPLAQAPSNLPHLTENGRDVYLRRVKPCVATLRTVVGHYAISSLFPLTHRERERGREGETERSFPSLAPSLPRSHREGVAPARPVAELWPSVLRSHDIEALSFRQETRGRVTLAIGRVRLQSRLTWDRRQAIYAVLHCGGHDIRCSLEDDGDLTAYERLGDELFRLFSDHSLTEVARALDASFGQDYFTLTDLGLDERQRIAQWLLADTLERHANEYREIYKEHQRLMDFLRGMNIHLPEALRVAAEVTLNADLAQAARHLTAGQLSTPELMQTFHTCQAEAIHLECSLDSEPLRRAFEAVIQRHIEGLVSGGTHALSALQGLEAAHKLNLGLNLWRIQNLFWKDLRERQALLDPAVALELGTRLGFSRTAVEKLLQTSTFAIERHKVEGGALTPEASRTRR